MPLLASGGCRPGEGERCFCHGECRGGLVCAAAGALLRPGQCVGDVAQNIDDGVCVEGSADTLGQAGVDPPPFWDLKYDLPKTDFAPPGSGSSDTDTGSTGDAGTDGSSSGTDGSSSGTDGSSSGTDGSSSGTDGSSSGT
jgi:hypothetical protein